MHYTLLATSFLYITGCKP